MSNLGPIKDSDGKTYLSLEYKQDYKGNNVGSKPEDFENLRVLGSGTFGQVFKTRSKIDNEIYAMKKMDLVNLKNEGEEYYKKAINESTFLLSLSHPHIIKYYNHFNSEDGNLLYIITEYVPNGDLDSFIKAHKRFDKHIPEEELWSIFLQCMEALVYVHKEQVIHRDIKPSNIFLGNNFTIKLGDFGVSTVKSQKGVTRLYKNDDYSSLRRNKNIQYGGTVVGTQGYQDKAILENKQYDEKVDIFAMGICFFEMCYFHKATEVVDEEIDDLGNKKIIFENIEEFGDEDVNLIYSAELLDIINSMLIEDYKKRDNAQQILEKIKDGFSKKYILNTSLSSTIRCLSTFKDIIKYLKSIKIDDSNIQNKPVIHSYINCLTSSEDKWDKSIENFRQILCTENPKLEKMKEIEPKIALSFIIEELYKEDNKNIETKYKNNNSNEHYIISKKKEAKTSKIDMLLNFNKKFSLKFNSDIIKKFSGLIKTSKFCKDCEIKTYSFSAYFFITIDLEQILKEKQLINLDIQNYFEKNKNQKRIEKYCKKCLKRNIHAYFNQFYTIPDLLIISIQRGNNYQYKTPVVIKNELNAKNFVESSGNKKYKLNGIVGYNNGNFFSIINNEQEWIRYNGTDYNGIKIESPKIDDTKEEVTLLFYEVIKSNK